MSCQNYPLRSVLYVPGENLRALEKFRDLNIDAVILDLEDGVAPTSKPKGRNNISRTLKDMPKNIYVTVRVNPVESDLICDDLRAFRDTPPHAFVLPKVEKADEVIKAKEKITAFGYGTEIKIWAMIETPLGVLNVAEIAAADPALECLVIGTSDLVKDLHALHTRDRSPVLYSLSKSVVAARAFGLSIIDGVHLGLLDKEGFEAACRQGRELGFDGKTLIHPSQIEAAHAAFGPSEADLKQAEKVMAAYQAAEKEGKGVVVVDGKLVEVLNVEDAKRLLKLADMIKAKG